ncbi:hypothetical protein RCO48_17040 [Peribacillus frigoritolerans]|nr:hypothetical protein [Peribacillus frigoritolerans]
MIIKIKEQKTNVPINGEIDQISATKVIGSQAKKSHFTSFLICTKTPNNTILATPATQLAPVAMLYIKKNNNN